MTLNHKNIDYHIERRRYFKRNRNSESDYSAEMSKRKREHYWRDDEWMMKQWRDAGYDIPLDHEARRRPEDGQ